MEKNFRLEHFNKAVLMGEATWWQMSLPVGNVIFGENKAEMLGYKEDDFKHFTDFMKLVHPDDYQSAMDAMRSHMTGKADLYETTYRIKHRDGHYIRFYDCGQITQKEGNEMTIMGFVMKVKDEEDILAQMKEFKDMILSGEPSIIDLVAGN